MLKLLITLIALILIGLTAKAQHLIVTNNNDTIEVKILEKDDSLYHVKRLQKPKREEYIAESLIKKIIANGDDTLYNTYSNKTNDNLVEETYASEPKYKIKNYNISEIVKLDSSQKKDVLFNKAQKFMALNFKNANEVIQLADRASGTLICKGTTKAYFENLLGYMSKGYIHFTITMVVKDGRYKYEINQVTYKSTLVNCNLEYPIEYLNTPCGLFESNWEEIKTNYQKEIELFILSFKQEMAKPVSDDW